MYWTQASVFFCVSVVVAVAVRYAVWYGAVRYGVVWYGIVRCDAVGCGAVRHTTLRYYNRLVFYGALSLADKTSRVCPPPARTCSCAAASTTVCAARTKLFGEIVVRVLWL